jgi:hypothetical protein
MRARPPQTDWRTWLDASLFPLKIFIVLAMVCMVGWHATLPKQTPDSWYFLIINSPFATPVGDFYTLARWAALACILSAVAMTIGGIIQAVIRLRRAALWNVSFAVLALAIGIWLLAYGAGVIHDAYSVLVT